MFVYWFYDNIVGLVVNVFVRFHNRLKFCYLLLIMSPHLCQSSFYRVACRYIIANKLTKHIIANKLTQPGSKGLLNFEWGPNFWFVFIPDCEFEMKFSTCWDFEQEINVHIYFQSSRYSLTAVNSHLLNNEQKLKIQK